MDWENYTTKEYKQILNTPALKELAKQVTLGQEEYQLDNKKDEAFFRKTADEMRKRYLSFGVRIGVGSLEDRFGQLNAGLENVEEIEMISKDAEFLKLKQAESNEKMSTQEERARIRRGCEYPVEITAAANAYQLYHSGAFDKEVEITSVSGYEFENVTLEGIINIKSEDMAKLMNYRRCLLNYINANENASATIDAQATLEYWKRVYASTDDVINTWFKASGIDPETGIELNKKKTEEAKKHLALALENYKLPLAKADIVKSKICVDMLMTIPSVQETVEDIRTGFENRGMEAFGKKVLLAGAPMTDVTEMYKLVYENEGKYRANKTLVDKIMKDLVKFNTRRVDMSVYSMALSSMFSTNENITNMVGLSNGVFLKMMGVSGSAIGAEASKAAMQFLLKGQKSTNIESIVYAKMAWNLDIAGFSIRKDAIKPIEELSQQRLSSAIERIIYYSREVSTLTNEYYTLKNERDESNDQAEIDMLTERMAEKHKKLDLFSKRLADAEDHKKVLENAIKEGKFNTLYTETYKEGEYEVGIRELSDEVYMNKSAGNGFRDAVRAFEPMNSIDEHLTADVLRTRIDQLSSVFFGHKYFDGQSAADTEEERIQNARGVLAPLEASLDEMRTFISDKSELFVTGDIREMMERMPVFMEMYKKAQSIRDLSGNFKDAFSFLPQDLRDKVCEMYRFSSAVFNYTKEIFDVLTEASDNDSYENFAKPTDKIFEYDSFNEAYMRAEESTRRKFYGR